MNTVRVTFKLAMAISKLSGMVGRDDAALTDLVRRRRVSAEQIYDVLHLYGYRWKRHVWYRPMPKWLESLARESE